MMNLNHSNNKKAFLQSGIVCIDDSFDLSKFSCLSCFSLFKESLNQFKLSYQIKTQTQKIKILPFRLKVGEKKIFFDVKNSLYFI